MDLYSSHSRDHNQIHWDDINTVFPDLKYIQKIVMHVQETVKIFLAL